MDRRSFVASTGALLTLPIAGCVDGDTMDPNDDTDSDTSSQREMHSRIEPEPTDDTEPLVYDVSIVSESTVDSPLTIDISLTNTSEVAITYGERRTALFWNPDSEEHFSLYPTDAVAERYEYDDGIWWLPDGFATTMDYQTATLEPDATHTETLALLHGPVDDADELRSLPSNLYFTAEFAYSADEDETLPNGTPVTWGFSLQFDQE